MKEVEKDWSDHIALVTGGSGDIGSAVAEALLALGARVAVADARPGFQLCDRERARFDVVDVTDHQGVTDWVSGVSAAWGTPTTVVISAAIVIPGRLIDTAPMEWSRVIDVNLTGAFSVARAAIGQMLRARAGGRLVFVGSWAAESPHPHIGAYSIAKAGLRALARTLALDHAIDGILVNEVAPGIVEAGMSRELMSQDDALRDRTVAGIPVGHTVSVDEVVRDVLHLVSFRNLSTTGAVLTSDGGLGLASTMNTGRDHG